MGNRAERTEHSGPKRGKGPYWGKKRWAKRDSAIKRRRNGRVAIDEQRRDADSRGRD